LFEGKTGDYPMTTNVLSVNGTLKPLLSELLRPRQAGDLNQPQFIIDRVQKMIETRSPMNMLFYGGSGTGKTSAARIFIDTLSPDDSIELDGSLAAGGDFVTGIQRFCSSLGMFGGVKICFVDQADLMPSKTQKTLSKVIEDNSDNARFLLAAANVSKIAPEIRSRVKEICFDIAPADRAELQRRLIRRLEERLSDAGLPYDSERLKEIVNIHFPDFRSIANQLQFDFGC
jgi:DNA polymerase III delta prime subunit